ncbi:MAG: Glycerophosphodiester phosphodiesterase [Luteibacter sp.]|uniref:glycerophosphodiester phosphodiesterase family protein n=1 Tax=Luteibacter sp. TaxID=1886636 RepID=UPI00137D091D|nr:glycerophosphodiester phosphodiesterase family protein [Luteibacter sp.]KAF1004783.1 MAG: Glycerophosphodiester phosphodiesterase [Luteibacter sp.]
MHKPLALTLTMLASALFGSLALAADRTSDIAARLANPDGGVVIVAHRGCHNAAPAHGLPAAPENSFAALDHCVALGVDVMETDIRRTRDGYLVIMHDATVDRMTGGTGAIADLTLAQVKSLRLRANQGGPSAALTDQEVPTLDELLRHAGNRIMINLDIKEAIYPEVIAAVQRLGATHRVIVKTVAGAGSPPLASMSPYDQVPFMPILSATTPDGGDLPQVLKNQAGGHRRPWGYELPVMDPDVFGDLAKAAHAAHGRLWVNTLGKGFVNGYGGDEQALRDPASVWGRLYKDGVTVFQTDEPEALAAFVARGMGSDK